MRAILNLDLKAETPEEAQRVVEDTCRKLQAAGLINDYRFEIETPEGPVTEKVRPDGWESDRLKGLTLPPGRGYRVQGIGSRVTRGKVNLAAKRVSSE